MIAVTLGTNTDRSTITVNPNKTLKEALNENKIDYSKGGVFIDGEAVGAAALNKTFEEFGIKEECTLIVAVKANGGC
jgi:hypothetical protein